MARINTNKKSKKIKNELNIFNPETTKQTHPLRKKFYILIDRLMEQTNDYGIYCFFITINLTPIKNYNYFKEKIDTTIEDVKQTLNLLKQVSHLAFAVFSIEKHKSGQPHIHIFLGIHNIIGNPSQIKNNLYSHFLVIIEQNDYMDEDEVNDRFDIEISPCINFINKAKAFKYVIKEMWDKKETQVGILADSNLVYNFTKLRKHYEQGLASSIWSQFWEFVTGENNRRSSDDGMLFFDKPEEYYKLNLKAETFDPRYADGNDDGFYGRQTNIIVIKKFLPIQEYTHKLTLHNIHNLFLQYFEANNLYVDQDTIYQEITNTKISVKIFEKIKDLENKYEEITRWMESKFYTSLRNFDWTNLKTLYLKKFIDNFLKNPKAFIKPINLNFNFIEFTDGIYIISTNHFIKKNKINLENNQTIINPKQDIYYLFTESLIKKNWKTTAYWPKTYNNLNKIPTTWLKFLSDRITQPFHIIDKNNNTTISIQPPNIVNNFCIDFAKFFNTENILKAKGKQDLTTFISGPSNTLKTTLTAHLLKQFYGMANIGMMTKSDNFAFEDILAGKKKIIVDSEFVIEPKLLNEFKDVISGDYNRKYGRKFLSADTIIEPLPVLLNSNEDLKSQLQRKLYDWPIEDVKAIENRITKEFFFRNPVHWSSEEYQFYSNVLSQELPSIIIYCNRLALRAQKKIKKYTRIETLKTYLNNEKSKKKTIFNLKTENDEKINKIPKTPNSIPPEIIY